VSGRTLRWLMSLTHRHPALPSGARAASRLTIIRHHRVYADGERPLYRLGVSESVFEAQLAMLDRLGLTPVSVAEGWSLLRERRPGHHVAMSFDDGYADNVRRALPRLEARSAKATFYLTAGWMESRTVPWWDLLADALERTHVPRMSLGLGGAALDLPLATRAERGRALRALLPALGLPPRERDRALDEIRARLEVASPPACELADWDTAAALMKAGMEVGAHTLEHPLLTRVSADEQRREIAGSIDLIERRLGVRAAGLAYPGGDYDAATARIAAECGLAYAVTTRAGTNDSGARAFELRRRGLSDGACLDPAGRFSRSLAIAELDGAFDRLRGVEVAP